MASLLQLHPLHAVSCQPHSCPFRARAAPLAFLSPSCHPLAALASHSAAAILFMSPSTPPSHAILTCSPRSGTGATPWSPASPHTGPRHTTSWRGWCVATASRRPRCCGRPQRRRGASAGTIGAASPRACAPPRCSWPALTPCSACAPMEERRHVLKLRRLMGAGGRLCALLCYACHLCPLPVTPCRLVLQCGDLLYRLLVIIFSLLIKYCFFTTTSLACAPPYNASSHATLPAVDGRCRSAVSGRLRGSRRLGAGLCCRRRGLPTSWLGHALATAMSRPCHARKRMEPGVCYAQD